MFDHLTWSWFWDQLQSPLVLFGFAAQFVFFLRFAVQWLESERRGRSHIPMSFWYLSTVGGAMTLVYATAKGDLVFMSAQGLSLLIYLRNLVLIHRRRARYRILQQRRGGPAHSPPQIASDVDAAT